MIIKLLLFVLLSSLLLSKNSNLDSIQKFILKLDNKIFNITPEITNEYYEILNNNTELENRIITDIKYSYYNKNLQLDSVYYLLKEFTIKSIKEKDTLSLINVFYQKGKLYSKLQKKELALQNFQKVHQLANKYKKDNKNDLIDFMIFESDIRVTEIYREWKKYQEAEEILYKYLNSDTSNKEYSNYKKASIFRNLINMYFDKKDLNSAKKLFDEFSLLDSNNVNFNLIYYSLYAYYHFLNSDYQEAIKFQKMSLEKREFIGYVNLIQNSKILTAKYFAYNNQIDSAEKYLKENFYFYPETQNDIEIDYYETLKRIAKSKGNIEEIRLINEILKIKSEEKIFDNKLFALADSFFDEFEKIDNLNEEKKDLKIIIYYVIGFSVLLIIFVFVYNRLYKKMKQKEAEMQKEIKSHIETQKEIDIEISNKNKLIAVISHDILQPLNSSYKLLKLAEDSELPAEIAEIVKISRKSISENIELLENMLKWIKKSFDKSYFSPGFNRPFEIINEIKYYFESQLLKKNISLINEIPWDCKAFFDYNLIHTALRNIIQNSIKYSPINGQIRVYCKVLENEIEIFVEDNGFGMDKDQLNQVNDTLINQKNDSFGDHGFGLIITKDFINMNKGRFSINSKKNIGTIINFTLKTNEF